MEKDWLRTEVVNTRYIDLKFKMPLTLNRCPSDLQRLSRNAMI